MKTIEAWKWKLKRKFDALVGAKEGGIQGLDQSQVTGRNQNILSGSSALTQSSEMPSYLTGGVGALQVQLCCVL